MGRITHIKNPDSVKTSIFSVFLKAFNLSLAQSPILYGLLQHFAIGQMHFQIRVSMNTSCYTEYSICAAEKTQLQIETLEYCSSWIWESFPIVRRDAAFSLGIYSGLILVQYLDFLSQDDKRRVNLDSNPSEFDIIWTSL
jgi:hypothetical protein